MSSWTCSTCEDVIYEQCLCAFGKYYHANCFVCASCGESINGKHCVEKDGMPVCVGCGAESCHACKEHILRDGIRAAGFAWHSKCFCCKTCNKRLTGKDGKAKFIVVGDGYHCTKCATKLEKKKDKSQGGGFGRMLSSRLLNRGRRGTANVAKCYACRQSMHSNATMLVALNHTYHRACFRCAACKSLLEDSRFVACGSKPLCRTCAADKLAEKCAKCNEPITTTIVVALKKNWHVHCLTCVHCDDPLSNYDKIYRRGKYPCCPKCVETVFSDRYRPSSRRKSMAATQAESTTATNEKCAIDKDQLLTSITSLLEEDVGVDALLEFMTREYCVENILFWLDVQQFRSVTNDHDIELYSRRIMAKYIGEEAELEINIDADVTTTLIEASHSPSLSMFDTALQSIMELMSMTIFPRFLNSDECTKMIASLH